MDGSITSVDADDHRLLVLIADGCSAAEAADALGWNLSHAGRRLEALRRRLGVDSTAQAVAAVVPRSRS